MWTSLSAGRWICLFALATLTYVSAWKGEFFCQTLQPTKRTDDNLFHHQKEVAFRLPPCCVKAGRYISLPITDCIKEEPTFYCNSNNYAVLVGTGKWYCISHDSRWMKTQIQKGKVSCPHVALYR